MVMRFKTCVLIIWVSEKNIVLLTFDEKDKNVVLSFVISLTAVIACVVDFSKL